jgi:hypothetical protein
MTTGFKDDPDKAGSVGCSLSALLMPGSGSRIRSRSQTGSASGSDIGSGSGSGSGFGGDKRRLRNSVDLAAMDHRLDRSLGHFAVAVSDKFL